MHSTGLGKVSKVQCKLLGRVRLLFTSPMDWILQARILEWVVFPFSRDLPNPGIKPRFPALQADSLPDEPQGEYKGQEKLLSVQMASVMPTVKK